jgi:hypothetical protein
MIKYVSILIDKIKKRGIQMNNIANHTPLRV